MCKYLKHAPILIAGILGELMLVGGLVVVAIALTQ